MSTPEWKDLERLWQSDLPAAAPALDVIARQRRRSWAWRLIAVTEILGVIVGVVVSIWVITSDRPNGLLIGGGALALTAFAAGASLWARSVSQVPPPERSLLAWLDQALHRARVSVRWGLASLWVMVPYMLFIAMLAFAWTWDNQPPDVERRLFFAIGACAIFGALAQAVAIVYYSRGVRELSRLDELRRALIEG